MPILDLKIPKPSFLHSNDKSPRVETPGAGAPGNSNGNDKDKPGGSQDERAKPANPGNSRRSGDAGSNGSDKVGKDAGQKTGVPGPSEKEKVAGSGNKKAQ